MKTLDLSKPGFAVPMFSNSMNLSKPLITSGFTWLSEIEVLSPDT